MQRRKLRLGALLILAALPVSACAKTAEEEAARVEPAKIEKVKGTKLDRLVLTEKAAERIGIETGLVRETSRADGPRKIVDYSSLIYDAEGHASVYTNPEPLVFVRHPVTVDYINGDLVVLTEGPPLNTPVVTVGVAELFGIDAGVGGNE
jgi:hypothetical protein